MLLEYRDPAFWEKFQQCHWKPRVPTVIRAPFQSPPFSEAMVLGAVKAFQTGLQGGDEKFRYFFALDGKLGPRRKALRAALGLESHSMAELERNCSKTFPGTRFGLMVNNFQSLDPGLWQSVTAFLQDAHRWIDFPIGRAIVDLFFGNYPQSFLGLHKDTQEIFGFVVRGEKTILAWPFDYFVQAEGISRAARFYQVKIKTDYRKYRRDALVLRARPGDVIFWPSDYWHISESESDDFSAMLSVGLFPAYSNPKRAAELNRFRDQLLGGSAHAGRGRSCLASREIRPDFLGTDGIQRLRWTTGFSFEFGSPLRAQPPPPAAPLVKKETCVLLWSTDPTRRRLRVAANGHAISLRDSGRLRTLLRRLSRGEAVASVGRYPSRLQRRSSSATTYWNKKGELKTRRLVSNQDERATLVAWLFRIQAISLAGRRRLSGRAPLGPGAG